MADTMELNIIRRVLDGDLNAFEFVVKRYERRLFVMVGNILREKRYTEDLVQDIFLSAYQHLDTFRPEKGRFSTWLFRIARNKCFNELKRRYETPADPMPESVDPATPDTLLRQKEIRRMLDQALNRLSFRDRLIFVLAEFNELPYSEIAAIEHVKIGTVKSRLSRTRDKLRKILSESFSTG